MIRATGDKSPVYFRISLLGSSHKSPLVHKLALMPLGGEGQGEG